MPKFRRTALLVALSTLLVGLTAAPASAAPVFANGFEDPVLHVEFADYLAGQQFGGWTVTAGSVDLTTDWTDAEGRQSLDLNGSGNGSVARTLPAQLLTTYKVTYALAGNPEGPPTVKGGKVTVNGQDVDSFTFSIAGKNNANMGWVYRSFYFTNVLNPSTVLQFSGTSGNAWGAVIDDIKVESCLLILCPASASTVNRIR
jgi:choice-of-anchor C domain-containing protein